MKEIEEVVEFLRSRLHELFVYGCHLTAKTPVIIKPLPKPSRFEAIKKELLQGYDLENNQDGTPNSSKLHTIRTIFANTIKHMDQTSGELGANASSNTAVANNLILPVLRRVMPNLIAFEIAGVQAMVGPVSQIHTLRVRYSDVPKLSEIEAVALEPRNFDGELSELEKEINKLKIELSSLLSQRTPEKGNRLSIQILKEVVEASTKRLAARWTFENSVPDDEIYAALAQEIVAELDIELLTKMKQIGGEPTSIFDMAKIDGPATFVGDVHAALAILINRQANLIAARTRRGAGNFCVVSPTALTILQSASTSAFAEGSFKREVHPQWKTKPGSPLVGTLNNAMRIYVNQYASDKEPVIVGYKGNDIDAAIFYCPYQPLITSGVIIDPHTFEPVTSFMSRNGMLALTNSPSSLGNASDYLGMIGINTNTLSFV